MRAGDTIVALATAFGRSPRGIIRLSGPRSLDRSILHVPRVRGTHRVEIPLKRGQHLPALALAMPHGEGSSSYTGEDTLELQIPGNQDLVSRVIAWLLTHDGVRLAEPGEFSARAYLNGRLTLEQAEGVAATIAASTREQLEGARALLDGATGREYRQMANECATLLALVEAGIDFTDQEDVVAIAPADLARRLDSLLAGNDRHLAGVGAKSREGALAVVALAGRPNAGKSTLFNALLGRDRAVASPVAHTTRDVLQEELDLSGDSPVGGRVHLCDLPGLDDVVSDGEAAVSSEHTRDAGASRAIRKAAQARANEALAAADLVLWCDPSGRFRDAPPGVDSERMLRVRTLVDVAAPGAGATSAAHGAEEVFPVCSIDGYGIGALRSAIARRAITGAVSGAGGLLPRHRESLANARKSLMDAKRVTESGRANLAEPEVIADALRTALDRLGELVGRISPDEILGRVFASFCVGK
ncbi:MAG: 50S ribosome-binding GTPase [Phycisphaerales bacterium]|nr:MAG: 50S ribosome-binding GTPase [Phycisphaerales bacterium]